MPGPRLVGLTAVAAVLLSLVGLASRPFGEPGPTSDESPGAGVLLVQVLASLELLVTGIVLLALVLLWPGRRRNHDEGWELFRQRMPVHWAVRLLLSLLFMGGVVALLAVLEHRSTTDPGTPLLPVLPSVGQTAAERLGARVAANFGTVFAMVAVLVAALGAGSLYLWTRGPSQAATPRATRELTRVVDDGLAALERETDPRRAVILAYVAMEHALAREGLPRHAPEAPVEYMLRVLGKVPAVRGSVHRLTNLFEEAKFSQHAIGASSRLAAVEALHAVRESLG